MSSVRELVCRSRSGAFLADESGAVTIDWVALTAGILLLGVAVVYSVFNGGVSPLVGTINDTLMAVSIDLDVGAAPGTSVSDVSDEPDNSDGSDDHTGGPSHGHN